LRRINAARRSTVREALPSFGLRQERVSNALVHLDIRRQEIVDDEAHRDVARLRTESDGRDSSAHRQWIEAIPGKIPRGTGAF
jgi:hypothetical protein